MKFVSVAALLFLGLRTLLVRASRKAETVFETTDASAFAEAGQQKDDPVDAAFAYLRNRIHEAQRGNKRLAERLAAAERVGHTARAELATASARLEVIPSLRKRVNEFLAEKTSALSELSHAWSRENAIKTQLQNVSQVSLKHAKTIARARVRLSQELRDRAELRKRVQDVTSRNKELSHTLAKVRRDFGTLQQAEQAKDVELARSRAFIANMQANVHSLQAAEEQDRSKLEATNIVKEQALESQHRAELKQKALDRDRDSLTKKLAALSAKEKLEAQYNQELSERLSAESLATAKRSEADADARARSADSQSRERSLRQQVLDLKKKLAEAESNGQQVKNQMLSARDDLFAAQTEVQDAQGAVPALEAKVAQEKAEAANVTAVAAEAFQERDASRAAFAATRQQMLHLEKQYADMVELVGKSAAKGASIDTADDVGGVEKELTALASTWAAPSQTQGGAQAATKPQAVGLPPAPAAVTRNLRGAPAVWTGLSQGLERDSAGLEQMLVGIVAD